MRSSSFGSNRKDVTYCTISLGNLAGGGWWTRSPQARCERPQRCHNNVRVTARKLPPMHASCQHTSGVNISGHRLVVAIDCDRCAYAPALTCGDQGRSSRIRGQFVGKWPAEYDVGRGIVSAVVPCGALPSNIGPCDVNSAAHGPQNINTKTRIYILRPPLVIICAMGRTTASASPQILGSQCSLSI